MKNATLLFLVLLGLLAVAGAVQGAEAEDMSEDSDMPEEHIAKADAFLMGLINNSLLRMEMQELIDAVDAGDESIVIVDVRPASLYDAGHIPDSINVPFPELVQKMDMVPTDKKIAVVCTYDTNSAFSVAVMRIFGDRDAWVVVSGVPAWQEAGRELVETEM